MIDYTESEGHSVSATLKSGIDFQHNAVKIIAANSNYCHGGAFCRAKVKHSKSLDLAIVLSIDDFGEPFSPDSHRFML